MQWYIHIFLKSIAKTKLMFCSCHHCNKIVQHHSLCKTSMLFIIICFIYHFSCIRKMYIYCQIIYNIYEITPRKSWRNVSLVQPCLALVCSFLISLYVFIVWFLEFVTGPSVLPRCVILCFTLALSCTSSCESCCQVFVVSSCPCRLCVTLHFHPVSIKRTLLIWVSAYIFGFFSHSTRLALAVTNLSK